MTITMGGTSLVALLLASLRITAWVVVSPPFNTRSVPAMAKVILGVSLSFAISPQLAAQDVPNGVPQLILMSLIQVTIGCAMGFVTLLLFTAVQQAGSFIDLFGNFQISAAYDPLAMNQNSVFGRFYEMLATTLLFVSGGYLIVIGGLLDSFRYLPLNGALPVSHWQDTFTTGMSLMFSIAIQVALPVVAVLFITDLIMALMSKVAVQLNPMAIMLGLKIGVTLLVVGLSFPVLPVVMERLVDLITNAMQAIGGDG